MSTIVLSCPGCGKRYELSGTLAGKKARCKACSREFTIPVPRQVSAPSTTTAPAAARPKASAPARAATPPPPPVLDQFDAFEDIEDHAAPTFSVSHDDDETFLPPRAGTLVRTPAGEESKPKKKKKKKRSSSTSSADWVGMIPLIAIGMVAVLTVIGLIIPPFAFLGMLIIILSGLIMMVAGAIWMVVNAFRESVVCGVLYMFMPFYSLYYLVTRWDDMARPFGIYLVGVLMVAVVPRGYSAAGMLPGFGANQQGLNNAPGANGVGGIQAPHVGFQPNRPANVNQDNANFVQPPAVGMPPNNGMPNNMPGMPANIGMPPNVPQPPNFGPGGPGGMNNFPGPPNNLPGPYGPGGRFGRPEGMPGQG